MWASGLMGLILIGLGVYGLIGSLLEAINGGQNTRIILDSVLLFIVLIFCVFMAVYSAINIRE